MPSINVTLKDGASEAELEKAKESVKSQGGKVTHDFKLIKGFTAELPEDKLSVLSSNDHITVEQDQQVKTQ